MISTKGRYALRVMIDLAEHEGEEYQPLKDVAERQGVSKKYLEIIVKELVEQMGGTIELQSESGKGTTFYISIPCEMINLEKKSEIII